MGFSLVFIITNLLIVFHDHSSMDKISRALLSESDTATFYAYLKTRVENIKFTFGKQKQNKLPVLDIK